MALVGIGIYAFASGVVGDRQGESQRQQSNTGGNGISLRRFHDPNVTVASFLSEGDETPASPVELVLAKASGGPADLENINFDQFNDTFKLTLTPKTEADKTQIADRGVLRLTANGADVPLANNYSAATGVVTIESNALESLKDTGLQQLSAKWIVDGKVVGETRTPLKIKIDTRGPILDSVHLIGDPDLGSTLVLRFDDDDLNESIARTGNCFILARGNSDGLFGDAKPPVGQNVVVDGKEVRIYLGQLKTATYRITVVGAQATATDPYVVLQDKAGNSAGGGNDQYRQFSSYPAPRTGPRVDFPEYLPAPEPRDERHFNPSDHVETRVVRLYYFRDAHRVAQLVNRDVESYNRAAVEQARRRAERARTKADDLTDQRRHSEREAVFAAEELRRKESQLAEARQALQENAYRQQKLPGEIEATKISIEEVDRRIQSSNDTLEDINDRLDKLKATDGSGDAAEGNGALRLLPPVDSTVQAVGQGVPRSSPYRYQPASLNATENDTNDAEVARLTKQKQEEENTLYKLKVGKAELEAKQDRLEQEQTNLGSSKLADDISTLEGDVAALRTAAARAQEDALQLEAKEDRAREDQFRQEVGAAHEDPDTYAPGDLDSVDPVARVSVSVIGEGVIQLRGPRKGIDKIRTMINQIDSPLGQVKVDIVTVQLNGERGERMEKPVGLVDAHLGLGRFLTAQSLMLLRKAIHMEATRIASESCGGGHYQVDRDLKYLYGFYGRDFIDELYEMDSEFLRTENKLLSLHSMDTISLHRALFTLALAKNEVRQRILANFMQLIKCELPQAEFEYRCSAEICPHKTEKFIPPWNRTHLPHHDTPHLDCETLEGVQRNAMQRYHFRNLRSFFDLPEYCVDTMNPAQREFIRLAQIYKARLVTELELKQRVIERGLVEDDRERDFDDEELARTALRGKVLKVTEKVQQERFSASQAMSKARAALQAALIKAQEGNRNSRFQTDKVVERVCTMERDVNQLLRQTTGATLSESQPGRPMNVIENNKALDEILYGDEARSGAVADALSEYAAGAGKDVEQLGSIVDEVWKTSPHTERLAAIHDALLEALNELRQASDSIKAAKREGAREVAIETPSYYSSIARVSNLLLYGEKDLGSVSYFEQSAEDWLTLNRLFSEFVAASDIRTFEWAKVVTTYENLCRFLNSNSSGLGDLVQEAGKVYAAGQSYYLADADRDNVTYFLERTRADLDRNKLLEHLIDEQQEKYIDLLEGTRAHIASLDNYLKRLSVAMEDDFKIQFYEPAFVRVREAARTWDVTLGVVERTSILTNNRQFAKVMPQATMEFDLPKREIAIKEAMEGAKALTQDMGALLQDPTFLATFSMMGGGLPATKVQDVLPTLPSGTDEQNMGLTQQGQPELGAALQALVPDPAIYKFETGTGYEIRPVIQPDGNSIVYDFNYMYTTNIREPVRADEKHLGRVKRHFINTQVQTSSFEMREVSRYQVALKAARTSKGVPLFEDIPLVGAAFRPAPSDQSSIQENIILAHSVVYPTVFDLMGLRWAPSVVDLDHVSLRNSDHVVRGRYEAITNSVFETTTKRVDEMLDIEYNSPRYYRPDLYHRQTQPSPYHPNGYIAEPVEKITDPTGGNFVIPDRRPAEFQQPPYDPRVRTPVRFDTVPYDASTVPRGASGLRGGVDRDVAESQVRVLALPRIESDSSIETQLSK